MRVSFETCSRDPGLLLQGEGRMSSSASSYKPSVQHRLWLATLFFIYFFFFFFGGGGGGGASDF